MTSNGQQSMFVQMSITKVSGRSRYSSSHSPAPSFPSMPRGDGAHRVVANHRRYRIEVVEPVPIETAIRSAYVCLRTSAAARPPRSSTRCGPTVPISNVDNAGSLDRHG
jgi:hypothetical protein